MLLLASVAQEQAIAIWEQAQGERAAGRVPSIANFQTLLSAAQAKRVGPATPEPAGEAGSLRVDSGLRRQEPCSLSLDPCLTQLCCQKRQRAACWMRRMGKSRNTFPLVVSLHPSSTR